MSEKQKMCTVMDLSTSILATLFAALMLTGLNNQFPLLTIFKLTWTPFLRLIFFFNS